MNRLTFSIAALFISAALCAQSDQLKVLANYMAGKYSSHEQHQKDTVNYYDIRLQIIPVWTHRKDGIWLYVEQAVAGSESKPYRQRVYHVTEKGDHTFESAVFTFSNPLRFANNVKDFERSISPDSLKLRDGCSVILKQTKENCFEGGTQGRGCASERQGAAYASAEVVITKNELRSWDRGFNEKGEQVWGATKGGYIFIKE